MIVVRALGQRLTKPVTSTRSRRAGRPGTIAAISGTPSRGCRPHVAVADLHGSRTRAISTGVPSGRAARRRGDRASGRRSLPRRRRARSRRSGGAGRQSRAFATDRDRLRNRPVAARREHRKVAGWEEDADRIDHTGVASAVRHCPARHSFPARIPPPQRTPSPQRTLRHNRRARARGRAREGSAFTAAER